jgi:phosphopantothenoylcysteine decarboxylase / phosphopantothenate---cysteine ligase
MSQLNHQHILLGVSAGIAAYKAPILVRALRAAGAEVQVVLTGNAHQFVTPTALQAVAGNPVRQDLWDPAAEAAMGHIELARWADLVLIAPATANVMAKLAHGFADELLTTVCLATQAPIVLAPAMNQRMYQNPATQQNIAQLQKLGYQLIGPASGEQACGEEGPGRMVEPADIVAQLEHINVHSGISETEPASEHLQGQKAMQGQKLLQDQKVLQGRKVMITAGPTVEAIDPVRYISNHSSGLQGLSLAHAALNAGAEVILVAGPKVPSCHPDIQRIDVTSAQDMQTAVTTHLEGVDIFIGVAAVADYRPANPAEQKMKRSGKAQATLTIELVENPDIIAGVASSAQRPALVIGFAAETDNVLQHARDKRKRKKLDAVVLNDVSDPTIGFNSADNAATLIYEGGEIVLPLQSKQQLADAIIRQLPQIFASQLADTYPETVTQ